LIEVKPFRPGLAKEARAGDGGSVRAGRRSPRFDPAKPFSANDNPRGFGPAPVAGCDIKATGPAPIPMPSICHATQGARHRLSADWISAVHLLDALRHFSNR
jgi:hypothetical protein